MFLWLVVPAAAAEPERIAGLVERLGDRNFATRETATKDLIELGEPALPAVRIALRTATVIEIAERLARIETRILDACSTSPSSKMEFAVIRAGGFKMGSPAEERGHKPDETLHPVKLTATFLIGKHEVTQEEYKALIGTNPSAFSATGENKAKLPKDGAVRFPVERTSWYDAAEFCNRLSAKDGYKPFYKIADAKSKDDSIHEAKVTTLGGNGYRLPTEAEWEYACRAGSAQRFSFGDTPRTGVGNFKMIFTGGYGSSTESMLGRTATIGAYPKNKWGLADMHGNVAEWCGDWYDKDYYANSPGEDPQGPAEGTHRAIRGGSWIVTDPNCRSAARYSLTPDERKDFVGFRVARTP